MIDLLLEAGRLRLSVGLLIATGGLKMHPYTTSYLKIQKLQIECDFYGGFILDLVREQRWLFEIWNNLK